MKARTGTAKLAGPKSPEIRTAVKPDQSEFPQFFSRQVFVNVWPGVTIVPSATVTSATKASQFFGAAVGTTIWTQNDPVP